MKKIRDNFNLVMLVCIMFLVPMTGIISNNIHSTIYAQVCVDPEPWDECTPPDSWNYDVEVSGSVIFLSGNSDFGASVSISGIFQSCSD